VSGIPRGEGCGKSPQCIALKREGFTMAKKTWWVVPVGVVLCGAVGAAETQENPPAVVAPQQTAQIADLRTVES